MEHLALKINHENNQKSLSTAYGEFKLSLMIKYKDDSLDAMKEYIRIRALY